MSPLLSRYLLFYNSLQALGWTISLFSVLSNFVSTKSVNGTYSSARELICFLQSLAFLEVIHGAIGIVPSGVLMPLLQWGGRTHFLLAIVGGIHEVQELPSVFITFLAWSSSEVIRYSHYAISCTGNPPFWITYLRYTAFIFLYPVGVGPGESADKLSAKSHKCIFLGYVRHQKGYRCYSPVLFLSSRLEGPDLLTYSHRQEDPPSPAPVVDTQVQSSSPVPCQHGFSGPLTSSGPSDLDLSIVLCKGSADFLPIVVAEIVPTLVQTTVIKAQ